MMSLMIPIHKWRTCSFAVYMPAKKRERSWKTIVHYRCHRKGMLAVAQDFTYHQSGCWIQTGSLWKWDLLSVEVRASLSSLNVLRKSLRKSWYFAKTRIQTKYVVNLYQHINIFPYLFMTHFIHTSFVV